MSYSCLCGDDTLFQYLARIKDPKQTQMLSQLNRAVPRLNIAAKQLKHTYTHTHTLGTRISLVFI